MSLISTAEVAMLAGVHADSVNRWVKKGLLTPAGRRPVSGGMTNLFNSEAVRTALADGAICGPSGRKKPEPPRPPGQRVPVTLDSIQPLGGWARQANCNRPDVDPGWFDATTNDGTNIPRDNLRRQYRAALVCSNCPVRAACYADAVEHRAVGVWGGVDFDGAGRQVDVVARLAGGWYATAIGGARNTPESARDRTDRNRTPYTSEEPQAA